MQALKSVCRLCRTEFGSEASVVVHWKSGGCEPLMQVCSTEFVNATLDDIKQMNERHLLDWVRVLWFMIGFYFACLVSIGWMGWACITNCG